MIKSQEIKKIGIIGGLGPDSTLDYYRGIINYFRADTEYLNYPEILIYSLNLTEFMLMVNKKRDYLVKWLLEKIIVLYEANVDFIAIASNTPHIIFDKLKEQSPIPLISIIDETLDYIKSLGVNKVGLLGTQLTMESDLYKKPMQENDIEIFMPAHRDQKIIHDKIFAELEIGIIKQETKDNFLSYVQQMIDDHNIEALILGCTELPLMFPNDELGIPFINTTKLHIESIIKYSINKI